MLARGEGWFAILGVTFLIAACGQIIGAEFDDLEPQVDAAAGVTGDAGTDGSGGTDGASGSGGVNGASGTQGNGGRGGAVGSGGASGAAGSAGSGGSGGSGGSAGSGGGAGSGGSGGAAGSGAASGATGSGGTDGSGGTSGTGGSAGDGGGGETIVINEVEGRAGDEDFIEIHNFGPAPFDLGMHKVADAVNVNQSPKYGEAVVFPIGTVVQPGGFVVVVGNQMPPIGTAPCHSLPVCYQTPWGVSASGERVYLLRPDNTEIDHADYPDEASPQGMLSGQSLGRFPNGTGPFVRTTISPGQLNVQAPP